MFKSLKELSGFAIHATDGTIGTVDDVFYEAASWMIRYVVVDTGRWLPGRRVLLAPVSIGRPDWNTRKLPVLLTRQKVRESPDINTTLPLRRHEELDLHQHYLWEPYWIPGFGGMVEGYAGPIGIPLGEAESEPPPEGSVRPPRLIGAGGMLGETIQARDGAAGHLEDFLFDELEWSIRWLLIDTGVWIPSKMVLIPVSWAIQAATPGSAITLNLPHEVIQTSPAYDPGAPLDPRLEERIFAHYRDAA